MINVKNNKGITMLALAIAIIVMSIISTTLIYNISTGANVRALNNMYNDIQLLKDRIDIYYSRYGKLPVISTAYTDTANLEGLNVNDNDVYYVIDLEALDNITLTYGKSYKKYKSTPSVLYSDLYVVNEQSHSVYYIKGIKFDDKIYYTIPGEYTQITTPEWSDTYTETKKYTDAEGNTAWIPAGFQVSLKQGETKISEGLVIRNGTDLNEFVWILVAGMPYSYDRHAFSRDGWTYNQTLGELDTATNSYKIIRADATSYYYTEAMPSDERTSVETYGGYYIARYEAGILTQRTAQGNATTPPIFQKTTDETPVYAYNYVTQDQAKSLSEGLYNKAEDNVTSKLCSSYAWDTALEFIEMQNKGWATNTIGENYNATSGETGALQRTGYHSVNNIYDIGGNVREWTTEIYSNSNQTCAARGGYFNTTASVYPAAHRTYSSTTNANNYVGFRATLYL